MTKTQALALVRALPGAPPPPHKKESACWYCSSRRRLRRCAGKLDRGEDEIILLSVNMPVTQP